MATFVVSTAIDTVDPNDGRLSLREAVALADASAGRDQIALDRLEGRTVNLQLGEIAINSDVTIVGDGDGDGIGVRISGNLNGRILRTDGNVELKGLELANGLVAGGENGGAILLGSGSLNISDCKLRDNSCAVDYDQPDTGVGGAIYVQNAGRLALDRTVISGNTGDDAGGIGAESSANIIIRDSFLSGNRSDHYGGNGGAISIAGNSQLLIDNIQLFGNGAGAYGYYLEGTAGSGGAISIQDSSAQIFNSSINGNEANTGGAIFSTNSYLVIESSTIAQNYCYQGSGHGPGFAGAIYSSGILRLTNSTVTGNNTNDGGFFDSPAISAENLEIANSIVAGNFATPNEEPPLASDVVAGNLISNGHNIFGSTVLGAIAGDRQNIAPSTLFAAIDPSTGGGDSTDVVLLRASVTNLALGGADWFQSGALDQIGATRPQPGATGPDAGAVESSFALSTVSSANNDVLTGTDAAQTLTGGGGHDILRGLGGADILNGGDGGDLLEGGAAADRLLGGTGIDIASFLDGNTAVTVDLRGDAASDTDTALRGGITDTLIDIEGAIGGGGADRFFGDGRANWFQGGSGKDTYTGGAARDLFDLNAVAHSAVGAGRDVITDFEHLVDRIDLSGIDADTAKAGDQVLRWVGAAALSSPGDVGYYASGGNTIIRISNDADTAAEAEIELTGIKVLSFRDFHL
jgi:hypothetical protein